MGITMVFGHGSASLKQLPLLLMTAIASAALLISCKKTAPKSELRDYDHSCPCDDMACWEKNSSQGSKDALACAASTVGAAADIATAGGASTAKRVVFGIQYAKTTFELVKNITAVSSRTYNIYVDGKATPKNILDLLRALSTGNADILKYVFGADYVKNPQLQCARDIVSLSGAIFNATSSVISLQGYIDDGQLRGEAVSLKGYVDILKSLYAMSETAGRFAMALNACTTSFHHPEVREDLAFISDSFKNIVGHAKAAVAITECGLQLYNSGRVLIQNSMCLAEDIGRLAESQENLARMRQETLERPAPNAPGQVPNTSCNGEPTNCNLFAAKKFGLWLYEQTYFSYATRSYLCADMCGNKGSGGNECVQYANEIFKSDTPYCSPYCKTGQCEAAVQICASHCCGQDASCTDAALSKIKSYNL